MNNRCFCLLIAVILISAGTCVGQSPCQAGPLQPMMGQSCLLGSIVFQPFNYWGEPPGVGLYFQPDVSDTNNPGFTVRCCANWVNTYGGGGYWSYGTGPIQIDSTFTDCIGCVNGDWFGFGYTATLPCTGAICDTILAPVITAVKAVATNYSVDLSGFPADLNGWGAAGAEINASGRAACSDATNPSVTTTAGEQLDVFADSNNIVWGNTTSAAFGCVQRTIEGEAGPIVEMSPCYDCNTVSTASLDSASFYFHIATIQAFANGDTGGGASQPLPRTLTPDSVFSAFSNKLQATSGGFDLVSNFTLGQTSDGINPVAERISLQVGSYGVTLPPQSLHMTSKGSYVYQGTINGESLQLQIIPGQPATYTLKAQVSGTTPLTIADPAVVGLTIGNDLGVTNTPVSK